MSDQEKKDAQVKAFEECLDSFDAIVKDFKLPPRSEVSLQQEIELCMDTAFEIPFPTFSWPFVPAPNTKQRE